MADEKQNLGIYQKILQIRKQIKDYEEQSAELTEEQAEDLRKQEGLLAKLVKIQERRIKQAYGTSTAQKEIQKSISAQVASLADGSLIYKDLADAQIKSFNTSTSFTKEIQKQIAGDERKSSILDDVIKGSSTLQSLQQKMAELGPEDVEARKALNNEYSFERSKLEENLGLKLASGELTKEEHEALLRVIKSNDENLSIAQKYGQVSKETKQVVQSQIDAYKKVEKGIRGVLGTAEALFSGFRGFVAGTLIGAGTLANKIGKVNSELGTTLFQTDGVGRNAGVLSFVFEDAAGNAKAIAQELGSTSRASFETQTNVGLMAMNMGISGGEAATLIGSFTRLNGNSEDVAFNLAKSTQEFAKQNGIIPAQLMSDLAQSAEEFALFGKQGGKNIIEAAGFAAKLGVNMKSISGISENLLDFESSITKELELGAMLGRNINLNKARELAFNGEIEEAAKETLKALGGQAAFERMNYYQKKQTADLLGVSVSELQKMVANEEQAAALAAPIYDKFSQLGEFLNGGLNKYLGTSLQAMGGMVASGAEIGANFKMMGGSLKGVSGMLGRVHKGVKGAFGKDALSVARKNLSDKQIAAGFGGKKAKDMLAAKAEQSTDIAGKTPTKSDGGLKGLAKGLRAMGDPKVLFGALNLIPTALGMVAILPGIPGMLAISVLGGPAGAGLKFLGKGLKSFGDTVSKALPQIITGLFVLAGFGAAMIPLGIALGKAAPAISAFGDIIKSAFEGIATVVTAVSNGLVSMLSVITLEKAAAMVTLGAGFGLLAIGIGSLAVAALLGGRTVTRFIGRIAESASLLGGGAAQGLQTTAQALMSMGSGLSMINDQLDRLNPEKLEALSDFSMSLSISGALTSVGNAVGGLVDSVSALIGGGEEEGSLSQYETDALKYLERIAVATEKGATIKGRDRSAFNPIGINNN